MGQEETKESSKGEAREGGQAARTHGEMRGDEWSEDEWLEKDGRSKGRSEWEERGYRGIVTPRGQMDSMG